jgi:hypothetical protein
MMMHGPTNPKLMFILKVSLASKTNTKSCQRTVSVGCNTVCFGV